MPTFIDLNRQGSLVAVVAVSLLLMTACRSGGARRSDSEESLPENGVRGRAARDCPGLVSNGESPHELKPAARMTNAGNAVGTVEIREERYPSGRLKTQREVLVLRDGRDTVASLMARGVRLKYAGRQWVGAHRSAFAAFQRLPPERVVIARYEDLLREPVQTLLTISERLRLSIGPEVRITIEVAAGEMIEGTERRWTQLSGKQKRFALDEIAEMQAELGYPVAE